MSLQDFINEDKSLLIAPAGYGKTYSLAECLNFTKDNEKQLILTHTHAGIASIKEKIKRFEINNSKYHIETITGFAQRYVIAYSCSEQIPPQEDPKYYPFIISKAAELFHFNSVKRTLRNSYQGLFVDEYQDCTIAQHELVLKLSEVVKTRILGDPLQGIFSFNDTLVDFDKDLNEFVKVDELSIPHRWYQDGNNKELGDALKKLRDDWTESGKQFIDLSLYKKSEVNYVHAPEADVYDTKSFYRRCLNKLIQNPEKSPDFNSLLIIVPEYSENGRRKGMIVERAGLKAQIDFTHQLTLLEAIDDKTYYTISKNIDDLILNINRKRKPLKVLNDEVFLKLFNKTEIGKWICNDRLIDKRKESKALSLALGQKIDKLFESPSAIILWDVLDFMKNRMKLKTKRNDLFFSILKCLNTSMIDELTVYDAMVKHKNIVRRVGRKIYGKCIGTTLLTKGLEFDTVAILNAHRFSSPKHFYVAITRASKRLIVFSEKPVIDF